MKAASFDYLRADSVEHALEVLDRHGYDAKLIAGGQSLVPMMAMRLARPAVLVDINRLAALKFSEIRVDSAVTGACLRQRDAERDAVLCEAVPLIREALKWVGHVQTRNRGTLGGSLAHADPSAELPLAAAVLDARIHLRNRRGERVIGAADFFLGPMSTVADETECLTQIEWPVWSGPGVACGFEEVAIRSGDFAMASAACQLQVDSSGACRRAAFGLGGVDGSPRVFPDLAARLVGRRIDTALAEDVAREAAGQVQPGSDMHADAEYRRHLAWVLLGRILVKTAASASGGAADSAASVSH